MTELTISGQRPKRVNDFNKNLTVETSTDPDPEAGCGCGENCNRSPGDACPIAEMPVWEVLFPGFDGGTDATDNLVKWVKAATARQVGLYLARHHPTKALDCKVLPTDLNVGFGEGLDLVIDQEGDEWVGGLLQDVDPRPGAGGTLWKLGDQMRDRRMENLDEQIVARFLDPEPISLKEYNELRTNSYGYKLLYPKLDDEALAAAVENTLKNCEPGHPYTPAGSYDKAMVQDFGPILLKRLKADLERTKSVATTGDRIRVGFRNDTVHEVTVTLDLGLSLLFSVSLDRGEVLSGPRLVHAMMSNAHDYLGVLLSSGEYTAEKFPSDEEGVPDHMIDFEIVDAYAETKGAPKVNVVPKEG